MWINNFLKIFSTAVLVSAFIAAPLQAAPPSPEDQALLIKIQKDTLQYFLRMSDKKTGLTRDSTQEGSPASIAATGFALASVAIAQSHGWLSREYAENQLRKTLKTLLHETAHKNGFFYHFINRQNGKRAWGSEVSSIDTALLLAGALLAGQYFPGTDIELMANKIYDRVDWQWMMNGTSLICMGWLPESGFLPYYWDSYNELIILQALAIGARQNGIPAESWEAWRRTEGTYNGEKIIHSYSGSLFTYQYAQAFIDFQHLDDHGVNYYENSRKATLANRDYSLSFRNEHKGYSAASWGLSASLGPGGYKAYGAKPGEGLQDGTIAPYAVIASLVFAPAESLPAIRSFYESNPSKTYGHFGFKDAFNLDKNWWSDQYIGVDQGISFLMLENYLNDGDVWKHFMPLETIRSWITRCHLGEPPLAASHPD